MSYVLKCVSGPSAGCYVALSGSAASYTIYLQRARVFATKEQAEREACGNEHAIRVDAEMRPSL